MTTPEARSGQIPPSLPGPGTPRTKRPRVHEWLPDPTAQQRDACASCPLLRNNAVHDVPARTTVPARYELDQETCQR
jgi:hypothetical protein